MNDRTDKRTPAKRGTTRPGLRTTETQDFTPDTAAKVHYLFQVHPLGGRGLPDVLPLGASGTIGRSPESDHAIVIADPRMSRVHVEFRRCSPGPYVFADRDSKNGMFVDGARVKRHVAGDGTVIRLGDTLFVVRQVGLDLPEPVPASADFVGFSPSFRRAVEAARTVAPTPTNVLLTGETGTGKEVLARYIHDRSGRSGRFVAVNCAAVSPALFESAVFGHRRGAFTGAAADFAGHARAARGGTLFLDEVGELAPETQAKLLRFVETGEVATVGDAEPGTVDVRIVAATNRDLEAAARTGEFRRDLFARLAQWQVALPPLRDRPEDVLLIAARALAPMTLTADAAEALALHDWPYNVRELLSLLNEVRVRHAQAATLAVTMLPDPLAARVGAGREGRDAEPARPHDKAPPAEELAALMRDCGDNISEVARRLGKDRRQVYRWLAKLAPGNADDL